MKFVVIGGTGLVGTEIVHQLRQAHEVVSVGRTSGDIQADIEDPAAVQALFEQVGQVDGIISVAGDGMFGPFDDGDGSSYQRVLQSKVMGQINLTRIGHKHLTEKGSITLTSGAVTRHPMPHTAAIAVGCGAIDGFVASVALELEAGKRINAVSLSLVKESAEKFGMDSSNCVPVADVAKRYYETAVGEQNGQAVPV